jgi:hypothetical protein
LNWSGYTATSWTTLTTADNWTDDRAWITDWRWATDCLAKVVILARWVNAAGGRIEHDVALLPPLPRRLAALELRRMLRQSRIEVREHVDGAVEDTTLPPPPHARPVFLAGQPHPGIQS